MYYGEWSCLNWRKWSYSFRQIVKYIDFTTPVCSMSPTVGHSWKIKLPQGDETCQPAASTAAWRASRCNKASWIVMFDGNRGTCSRSTRSQPFHPAVTSPPGPPRTIVPQNSRCALSLAALLYSIYLSTLAIRSLSRVSGRKT